MEPSRPTEEQLYDGVWLNRPAVRRNAATQVAVSLPLSLKRMAKPRAQDSTTKALQTDRMTTTPWSSPTRRRTPISGLAMTAAIAGGTTAPLKKPERRIPSRRLSKKGHNSPWTIPAVAAVAKATPRMPHSPTTARLSGSFSPPSRRLRAAAWRCRPMPPVFDHDFAGAEQHLRRAVVAAEDASFFTHEGFDWEGMKDAVLYDLEKGELKRGGSTITQQLAKNLYLSSERSIFRKAHEALIQGLIEDPEVKAFEV